MTRPTQYNCTVLIVLTLFALTARVEAFIRYCPLNLINDISRITAVKSDESDTNGPYDETRRSFLSTAPFTPIIIPLMSEAHDTSLISPNFHCLDDLPPVGQGSVRLFLCRHGQTENNRLRKVQGARIDPPINDYGTSQAKNLGKAVVSLDSRPTSFFSSKLLRAVMTAQNAASQIDPGIQVQQLSELAEVDFGPIAEGQPIELAKAGMGTTYAAWAMGNVDFRPTGGGDSGREVLVRGIASINALTRAAIESNGPVLAVTHSTFLRILLGLLLDESLVTAASRRIDNGGITVIDVPKTMNKRSLGPKPNLLGGVFSQVPADFESLQVPVCNVVRINECRHLPPKAVDISEPSK